ncbi:MAG: alpha/beta hydrolase, partial [Bacteroidales bacterium]
VRAGDVEIVSDTLTFTDPQILIVTNRAFQSDGTNDTYFPNQISEDGSLTYLKGNFKEARLMVSKKQNFDDLVSQNSGYKDWLVFVHGDSKTLAGAAKRALEIQSSYQVNVIVFSWPSRNEEKGGWKNFKTSKKHVEEGVDEFFIFLNQLESWRYENQSFFTHHNLSILFHSLGNYYLERLVKEGMLNGYNQKIFDNLIVNAAAVNQKDHHLWLDQINIQERIIVNTNDQDYILKGVRLLKGWERQLGEDVKRDHASNAIYVSFTELSKSLLPFEERHGYYLGPVAIQSEAFRNYYYTIIHGEAIEKEVSLNFYTRK